MKKEYQPPRLTEWGEIQVVTQALVSSSSVKDGTVIVDVKG